MENLAFNHRNAANAYAEKMVIQQQQQQRAPEPSYTSEDAAAPRGAEIGQPVTHAAFEGLQQQLGNLQRDIAEFVNRLGPVLHPSLRPHSEARGKPELPTCSPIAMGFIHATLQVQELREMLAEASIRLEV